MTIRDKSDFNGEKVSWFKRNSSRGGLDREVNKHGWAGWQGNKISSKETTRGTLNREVNKKQCDRIESSSPIE